MPLEQAREAIAKLEGQIAELRKEREAVVRDGFAAEAAMIDYRIRKLRRELATAGNQENA